MAFSITRKEIEGFWRRKETEKEERRLAAEKEAARTKAKTLKMEDYLLFEQMIREILEEGDEGDGGITKNSTRAAAEAWIGIKHWWKKSTYAYLNEPAATASMDEKGRSRRAVTYIPQDRCLKSLLVDSCFVCHLLGILYPWQGQAEACVCVCVYVLAIVIWTE